MRAELQRKLKDAYPQIFRQLHNSTPMRSLMAFGIECNDGWYDLIDRLCADIMAMNPPEDFEAHQIKEKFGGLRFYAGPASNEIFDRIEKAEEESFTICEDCGTTENVTVEGGWILTLCQTCRSARK